MEIDLYLHSFSRKIYAFVIGDISSKQSEETNGNKYDLRIYYFSFTFMKERISLVPVLFKICSLIGLNTQISCRFEISKINKGNHFKKRNMALLHERCVSDAFECVLLGLKQRNLIDQAVSSYFSCLVSPNCFSFSFSVKFQIYKSEKKGIRGAVWFRSFFQT